MKRKYGKIIKKIAKQNGVSEEVVYSEIQKAISAGYSNPDPTIQTYWKSIFPNGEIPTPEKMIEALSKEIKK